MFFAPTKRNLNYILQNKFECKAKSLNSFVKNPEFLFLADFVSSFSQSILIVELYVKSVNMYWLNQITK